MPPKRPALSQRASEFAESDTQAARPAPAIHGEELPSLEVVTLRLREIMPNTRQPRTRFDDAALDELAQSIREHGVIQPIIVKTIRLTNWEGTVRRYELIAGERRWRASERAEQATIPAIIREETSDARLLELALIENLQRADLTPLEEAAAFEQMQRELGYSYDQIGQRVGKSKGYVMNRMRLLRLDADLRDLVAERPDTLSHIIHLEKLTPEVRAPLLAAVRDNDLSLAETRRAVEQRLAPSATTSKAFLRKNDLDEVPEPPAPSPADASPNISGSEVFLRKNGPPAGDARSTADSSEGKAFLRKNEAIQTRAAIEDDVARVRKMLQHWQNLPALPAQDRTAVLAALQTLSEDLENIMRRVRSEASIDEPPS